jgi:hypothetical protein
MVVSSLLITYNVYLKNAVLLLLSCMADVIQKKEILVIMMLMREYIRCTLLIKAVLMVVKSLKSVNT